MSTIISIADTPSAVKKGVVTGLHTADILFAVQCDLEDRDYDVEVHVKPNPDDNELRVEVQRGLWLVLLARSGRWADDNELLCMDDASTPTAWTAVALTP
eukprot:NODE_12637_length_444_cov_25.447950_g12614_i0.p2 GENE.NODE_12637_length_444_cov_25.447950_g12614_i0~~NODE_12637_length_444_cov_25.447950_g12614_i0.p2  ORF type:complete len:100 (+),score=23.78 NODE_12637_length_444_cov_25.447950_g12614_i0:98-397(+)